MKKRLLGLCVALCLTLLLCVTAWASSDSGSFTITWNYPDPSDGSNQTYMQIAPADMPVYKPDGVPFDDLMWVNKYDPTDVYDPWNMQLPTGDKTYVPVFTITWGDPTAYHVDKVPYKQPVNVPADYVLPDEVKDKEWRDIDVGVLYAPHNAYRDETYSCDFIINWNYPDYTGADTTYVVPTPAGTPVTKPDTLPNNVKYLPWVNKDDPTDVYDPNNPQLPTGDKTYIPVFTITWDNPTEADVVNMVPYLQTVNKPLDAQLEGKLEDQPWVNEDGDTYTPHNATKDELYKPAYNITWEYPDDTGTPIIDPTQVPYDEDMTPPYPYIQEWVDEDGNPFVPGKPTGDKTYVPVYTITWGDPTAYHTDKVPYQKPVVLPDTKDPNPLPAAVQGKEWKDVDTGAVYTPHNAYRDETYSCGFIINWNYPDETGADQTETVPTPAGTPVTKPATLPDNVKDLTWVNKDDPAEEFVPGQPPTSDVTYVPVFTIKWDNPNDPDVTDYVPYNQPVVKPDLEDAVENQPWLDDDDVPYTPHNATKDETYKPIYNITWNYPDDFGMDVTDPTQIAYDDDVTPPYPYISEWVDQDGNPYVPGQKPIKDVTYVPLYTITWGDPAAYHVDKVPYKQPVNVPADYALPDGVKNKTWVDKDSDTPYAPHNATKDETYVPQFNITWDPNNGTDPVKTEQVKQGVTPSYGGANPSKANATFQNWSPTPYPADKDETYVAQYKARPVVSLNWDFINNTISCTVSTSEDTIVFCATYDDYGRFIGFKAERLNAGASETLTFTLTSGAANAKLMLTDAFCAPLCGGESVDLSQN